MADLELKGNGFEDLQELGERELPREYSAMMIEIVYVGKRDDR